jgi:hypothetical protein
MNRRIRDKIFGFFGVFLWINASSFFSKKIRDWDLLRIKFAKANLA